MDILHIERLYDIFIQNPSIQTDTRKLKKGDLFFALKGPNFNGNLFAQQALDAGAAYVIVDEPISFTDQRVLSTNDVLQTLQNLAHHHRKQFSIPFIAITGSNGKTTTKELLHVVLSSKFKTYTTEGNLNNHIGIPLTILKIKNDAEIAIIEMGANHLHEIESYCEYAMPTHGLITNIGKAHLEGFGGPQGVKRGKGELFEYLNNHNGIAFINADDSEVMDLSNKVSNKVLYGNQATPPTGRLIQCDPFIEAEIYDHPNYSIKTHLVGGYNLPNILAAIAVGKYFGVAKEKMSDAIAQYLPGNSRSQLLIKEGNSIILDAYNANPGSMKAAIQNFAQMNAHSKYLFLGDMKELGSDSAVEHQAIVDLIEQYNWNEVLLVGPLFRKTHNSFTTFENAEEAATWLKNQKIKGAFFLIKGSNSMHMEKVIAF